MPRNPALQVRLPNEAFRRLSSLRRQRHLNVSAWARHVLLDALARDFPEPAAARPTASTSPGSPARDATAPPIPGWRPARLPGGGWGSALSGPAAASLPDHLSGHHITVTDRSGNSWIATVTAVVERSPNRVTVSDSGRPGKHS